MTSPTHYNTTNLVNRLLLYHRQTLSSTSIMNNVPHPASVISNATLGISCKTKYKRVIIMSIRVHYNLLLTEGQNDGSGTRV